MPVMPGRHAEARRSAIASARPSERGLLDGLVGQGLRRLVEAPHVLRRSDVAEPAGQAQAEKLEEFPVRIAGKQARRDTPAHDLARRGLVVVDADLEAQVHIDRGELTAGLRGARAYLREVVIDRRRHHRVRDEHAVGDLPGEPRDLQPMRREVDRDLLAHGGELQAPPRERDDFAARRDRLAGQEAAHHVDGLAKGGDRQRARDAELAESGPPHAERQQRTPARQLVERRDGRRRDRRMSRVRIRHARSEQDRLRARRRARRARGSTRGTVARPCRAGADIRAARRADPARPARRRDTRR